MIKRSIDIVGINFVGSTPTGRDIIYRRCGGTGKRVIARKREARKTTLKSLFSAE